MNRNVRWTGRKRTVTDEQVKRALGPGTIRSVAAQIGVSQSMIHLLRNGYQFKKPSP